MLDKSTARDLVLKHVNASYRVEGDELVVLDEETIEKEYGWVFFYNSRRYVESGDILHAVAGNAPIIVEKESGRLVELGTALPLEEYIKEYEARGKT